MNLTVSELERVFGLEWEALSLSDASLVCLDLADAACSADEYARRIGDGNLQRYVLCLRPRAGRTA